MTDTIIELMYIKYVSNMRIDRLKVWTSCDYIRNRKRFLYSDILKKQPILTKTDSKYIIY